VLGHTYVRQGYRCQARILFGHLDIDTPNVRIHDRALSWLDIDTPNVRMYDRTIFWLDIDTPNVRMYDRALHTYARGIDVKPG
jgi:hypothetical protein